MSVSGAANGLAALLTRMSMPAEVARRSRPPGASIWSGRPTWVGTASASPPAATISAATAVQASALRLATTTRAPAAANPGRSPVRCPGCRRSRWPCGRSGRTGPVDRCAHGPRAVGRQATGPGSGARSSAEVPGGRVGRRRRWPRRREPRGTAWTHEVVAAGRASRRTASASLDAADGRRPRRAGAGPRRRAAPGRRTRAPCRPTPPTAWAHVRTASGVMAGLGWCAASGSRDRSARAAGA